MKYTNPYDITINCTPFFDSGCAFEKLHMYEEIGGEIAYGELKMVLDGSEESVNLAKDQYTGHLTLEKEGGNIYEVDFFITYRQILNNSFTIQFLCVPNREFFTNLRVTSWDDITGAIQSLYPGKIELRCESDVNNGVKFFQQRETDHTFCSRLCTSFKHDIVFAFGWEGLLLKDTIGKDHMGNDEPYYKIYANQEVTQITDYSFTYNNLLFEDPINPWEEHEDESNNETLPDKTELESKNCCCMRTYSEYRIMGREYFQPLENRNFNLRYLDSSLFTSVVIVDTTMPNWKIGDVVYYGRRWSSDIDVPFDTFLVKSNEVFFSADSTNYVDSNGLKFSWTTKLLGLKEGGEVLPQTDPNVSTQDN